MGIEKGETRSKNKRREIEREGIRGKRRKRVFGKKEKRRDRAKKDNEK